MLVSKASRSDLLRRLSQSRNPEVMRRIESSHGQEAEYRHMLRPFQGRDDFDRRSDRKSINFVERFKFDPETRTRRIARPGVKTSLPRRRSLTENDKTYLGLPGNKGEGTLQGHGAFRGGETVDYQLTGNRRVRKSMGKSQQSYGGNGAVGRRIPDADLVEKGALSAANAASTVTRAGRRSAMSPLGRQTPTTSIPSLKSLGKRPPVAVAKSGRSYDPEARRQRRLGAEVAAGTLGGGLLAARGVRGARLSTQLARRGAPFAPTAGQKSVVINEGGKAKRRFLVPDSTRRKAEELKRGFGATRGDLARILGGTGVAGVSVAAGHRASRDSNDRWY